jgi:hypothetical protein
MNELYDALEECLNSLERGADVEAVLARYPHRANELRPLLDAAVRARGLVIPEPSAESFRRGRAALLQRAAQMREAKVSPARGRVIPFFQRLAISFALLALLLLSGTSLVRASSGALPGEKLYPVKRTWEDLRLLLVFDHERREALADEFENERLHEVNELLAEGRHETIQFAGVWMEVNGRFYVSGIQVVLTDATQMPDGALTNGAAVIIRGRTNADGFVEVESVELLPAGSVVPAGNPVEVETETEETKPETPESGGGLGQGSGNEAGGSDQESESETEFFKMEGAVEDLSGDTLVINGRTVYPADAEVKGVITIGAYVEVEGYFSKDGRFIATKIEVKKPGSNVNEEDRNPKPNTNDNDNGGDDSEKDDDNGDDDSGHGGDDDD